MPSLDVMQDSVQRNPDVTIRKRSIGRGVVDAADKISARSTDDVLGLPQVMVHRRMLILAYDQELLRIRFPGVRGPLMMPIADGEHHQPDLFEAAGAEIGDVPSQSAVPDLVALPALREPLGGGPIREGRQPDLMRMQ